MNEPKALVILTDHNWHNYLPMDYLKKLVQESPVGPEEHDRDDEDDDWDDDEPEDSPTGPPAEKESAVD
jgi:hypothetical protein